MNKTEAAKVLGDIGKNPSEETVKQMYGEFSDFYDPLFFDSAPSEGSIYYKFALAKGFEKTDPDEEKYMYLTDDAHTFVKFGDVCEAYHVLSDTGEWNRLAISPDMEDYKQYRRGYAPKTKWQKFADFAKKLASFNILLWILAIASALFLPKNNFYIVAENFFVFAFILLRLIVIIAAPLDTLLLIPRTVWVCFHESKWIIGKFFSVTLGPLLGFVLLIFSPMSVFDKKDDAMRYTKNYRKYKEERAEQRCRKILSEIESRMYGYRCRQIAYSIAAKVIDSAPSAYEEIITSYMNDIRRDRPVWNRIMSETEDELRQLEGEFVRTEKKHRRQEMFDEWGTETYIGLDGEIYHYDQAYLDMRQKEREKERKKLQNKKDYLEQERRIQLCRLRTEAVIRYATTDLGVIIPV